MSTQPQNFDNNFLPDFCSMRMVFVVVIIAQLFAFVLSLAPLTGASELGWQRLGLISLFVQWCALGAAGALCLLRKPLCRLSNTQTASIAYLVIILVITLMSELAYQLVPYVEYYGNSHAGFLTRNTLIGAIIAGPVLRYFYVQQQWRQRVRAETEARLQALQSRIRPHFLFNSMNTIASLTRSDPQQAEMAVENLADLFRASLKDARTCLTLREELDLCQRYLAIETLRLGDERLQLNWQVDDLPGDALIPALTLQPLLENAIYHGIEPLTDGGTIEVSGQLQNRQVEIRLQNPLDVNSNAPHHQGNRLAQDNTRERLAAFFGSSATLDTSETDHTYSVTLRFPYETTQHENPDR